MTERMDITGIGLVAHFGKGLESLKKAMLHGAPPPSIYHFSRQPGLSIPVCSIPDELFNTPAIRTARRANRFVKMAMLAAADCLENSTIGTPPSDRMGIIIATGLGPNASNMEFGSGLIQYGLDQGSPTHFSHSVHNSAAAYICGMLKSHSPATTITHFQSAVGQALQLAEAWLETGRCDHVLLGAVDEIGELIHYGLYKNQSINSDRTAGEGAAFLLLSRPSFVSSRLASIQSLSSDVEIDLGLVDDSGVIPPTQAVYPRRPCTTPEVSCSRLWGKFPTGSVFSLASAVLILRNEECRNALKLETQRDVRRILCTDQALATPPLIVEK
jgi:3-oxoacyl-(acyl-carrier-protein) synthase